MGLKKLFKSLKECKNARKDYYIKPQIDFEADTVDYAFYLIPTIVVQPWPYRYRNTYVVSIIWLNFAVGFGMWKCRA